MTIQDKITQLPHTGMVYVNRATGISALVLGVKLSQAGVQTVIVSTKGQHGMEEVPMPLSLLLKDFRPMENRP